MHRKLTALMIASASFAGAQAAQAQESIVFAANGGTFQDQYVTAVMAPATEAAGVELRQDTHNYLASIRLQVQSGNPAWDLILTGCGQVAVGDMEGLWEPLDLSAYDLSGIPESAIRPNYVTSHYFSTILGHQKDKYGDNPPKSWADFWDVEKFPGRRSMSANVQQMLEIALLADGVEPDAIYPLDVDRAIESVKKIAPHITVWWKSGAQATQLLMDEEVDMMAVFTSRVVAAAAGGAPVTFTYNQGILAESCLAIPKGARNKEAALKVIGAALSPQVQANIPLHIDYQGPVNQKAFEMTTYSDEILARTNSSPENVKLQVIENAAWWAEHGTAATEAYKSVQVQ